MAALLTDPPERGTYQHVLIREDVSPDIPQCAQSYDEVCESRMVAWKGRQVSALFVRSEDARNRFVILGRPPNFGWQDITAEWMASLDAPSTALDADAEMVLLALADGPQGLGAIATATGLDRERVLDLLGTLASQQLVSREKRGVVTTYGLTEAGQRAA